ncbi:predicted protein [Histoplasma mississippiense (nom. inval.)]|uniref:predicted protein n=1 Tax=Ajellomyces capsulatus (strain NAm1 / WU24) TaxID=2059318 RepID=UPI000157CAEF|nr:predicted protein [Histoplasma mississippiense (nom. inval.)]EDN09539.1 predicted protein [Histoplasma mississippiense (nom. inval.)]
MSDNASGSDGCGDVSEETHMRLEIARLQYEVQQMKASRGETSASDDNISADLASYLQRKGRTSAIVKVLNEFCDQNTICGCITTCGLQSLRKQDLNFSYTQGTICLCSVDSYIEDIFAGRPASNVNDASTNDDIGDDISDTGDDSGYGSVDIDMDSKMECLDGSMEDNPTSDDDMGDDDLDTDSDHDMDRGCDGHPISINTIVRRVIYGRGWVVDGAVPTTKNMDMPVEGGFLNTTWPGDLSQGGPCWAAGALCGHAVARGVRH